MLGLLEGEISYTITKKCIVFSDENSILYGDFTSDIADYYVKETVDFLASEFSYSAKLNKEKLLSAIDRVMIFIDGGDKRALSLEFSPGELSITTVRAGSVETVECTESPQATFNCYINADMFIEQLKAYEGEVVTIMFGLDYAIELSGTNTKQIISLMSV